VTKGREGSEKLSMVSADRTLVACCVSAAKTLVKYDFMSFYLTKLNGDYLMIRILSRL
jgi:hypothetical protein